MSPAKDFLSILQNDYNNFEKYFKSLLKNYSRVFDFIERVIQIIPLEVFVLLFFSLIILILINSVSPSTSKINFLFAVLASVGVYFIIAKVGVLNKKRFSDTMDRTFISALFLLIPVYSFYFLTLIYKYFTGVYRKRKIASPVSMEKSIFHVQSAYNDLMSEYYSLSENNFDTSQLKEKIQILQIASDGLLNLLNPVPKPMANVNHVESIESISDPEVVTTK
ncbi:MAG TPA: hypothetical protein PK079_14425 [Leptospiraceae bacterium]|nr:hypothetical protein [Leptospiraceae bacterium]HMX31991.1 hypothetical protein [Leptospiraceae bacterium]HMY33405.1 hypothetical protein [Leptospiraceae bacterium]HMZ64787.1 hypothetical protein [Leptospiraceae bacterium]HNA08646.1 hypothetical protein [Leptospiraceae bacterium]